MIFEAAFLECSEKIPAEEFLQIVMSKIMQVSSLVFKKCNKIPLQNTKTVFVNFKMQKYHCILDHVFPAHEHRFMLHHISSTFWVIAKFICIFCSSIKIRLPLPVLCAPLHGQPLLLHSSLDYEALSTPVK